MFRRGLPKRIAAQRFKQLLVGLLSCALATPTAFAAIPPQKQLVVFNPQGMELPDSGVDYELVKMIIPLNLNSNSDSVLIPRILDHSVQNLLKTSSIQKSVAGRAVQSLEQGMKTDMTLGAKSEKNPHKVSFQIKAIQREAKFNYTGLTTAQVLLNFETTTLHLEIKERLNHRQEVVLQHRQGGNDVNIQHLAWRYRW